MIDKIKNLLGIKSFDKKLERVFEIDSIVKSNENTLISAAKEYTEVYKGLELIIDSVDSKKLLKEAESKFLDFQKSHLERVSKIKSEHDLIKGERDTLLSDSKISTAYGNYSTVHKAINLDILDISKHEKKEAVSALIKAFKLGSIPSEIMIKAIEKASEFSDDVDSGGEDNLEKSKKTKDDVNYVDNYSDSNGQCQFCELFSSGSCSNVAGKIKETGHCSLFKAAEIVAEKSEESDIEKSEEIALENEKEKKKDSSTNSIHLKEVEKWL